MEKSLIVEIKTKEYPNFHNYLKNIPQAWKRIFQARQVNAVDAGSGRLLYLNLRRIINIYKQVFLGIKVEIYFCFLHRRTARWTV